MEPIQLYIGKMYILLRSIIILSTYNYLGVILDSEMTLRPFFIHVRMITYCNIFILTKIRII